MSGSNHKVLLAVSALTVAFAAQSALASAQHMHMPGMQMPTTKKAATKKKAAPKRKAATAPAGAKPIEHEATPSAGPAMPMNHSHMEHDQAGPMSTPMQDAPHGAGDRK